MMRTERNERFCFQTEPMSWPKILKIILRQEVRRRKRMEYRLPKEDDEQNIKELLEEYLSYKRTRETVWKYWI